MRAVHPSQSGLFWWAGASVVFMIVGSIGPWARALFVNVSGLEGDGVITLAIALGAAVALWRYAAGSGRGFLMAVAIGAAIAAGIAIYDAIEIESMASTQIFGEEIQLASVGWGLYVVIAGSISLAIAALALYRRRPGEPERKDTTTPS